MKGCVIFMENLTYRQQLDLKNIEKIREHLKELPIFCGEYFRSLEIRKSTNTRKNYAYDLNTFFFFLKENNPYFANKNIRSLPVSILEQIDSTDIEEYLSFLEAYHKDGHLYTNNDAGKARKLSSLKSFFEYYHKRKIINVNPVAQVDAPKIKEKTIIRFEPDEIALFLDEAESGAKLTKKQSEWHRQTKLRDVALLTLLLGTGIRVSECVGLDLLDIDFRNNTMKITRKGGNEALIYFSDEVAEALLIYLEEDRYKKEPLSGHEQALFISTNLTRLSVRSIERLVKKYARLVTTVKKITPHKLRSTYGTALYDETGDIFLVAETLGHKDVNTTRAHYVAVSDEKRRAASQVKLRERPKSKETI